MEVQIEIIMEIERRLKEILEKNKKSVMKKIINKIEMNLKFIKSNKNERD